MLVAAFSALQFYSFAQDRAIYHKDWIDFNKNGKKDVYEDSKQTIASRVDDLLSQMTTHERLIKPLPFMGMDEF